MHHRMGSYFDSTGVIMPPPGSMAPPKKGILCVPPPPPPTSSIPSGKNKQRQLSVSTTELPIRPSLVSKGLGSEGPTRCEFIRIHLNFNLNLGRPKGSVPAARGGEGVRGVPGVWI